MLNDSFNGGDLDNKERNNTIPILITCIQKYANIDFMHTVIDISMNFMCCIINASFHIPILDDEFIALLEDIKINDISSIFIKESATKILEHNEDKLGYQYN